MLTAPFRLVLRVLRGFAENPLAFGAFVLAALGGFAVSDSWLGHFVGNIVNLGPFFLPHVLFAGSVFVIGCDLFRDGIAERFAIYLALVTPSFAMAIPDDSKGHQALAGWITYLNDWLDRTVGPYISGGTQDATLTVIGMCGIAIAVIWCERYAKNGGSQQMAAPAGTTTASTTSTTAVPSTVRRRAR